MSTNSERGAAAAPAAWAAGAVAVIGRNVGFIGLNAHRDVFRTRPICYTRLRHEKAARALGALGRLFLYGPAKGIALF